MCSLQPQYDLLDENVDFDPDQSFSDSRELDGNF